MNLKDNLENLILIGITGSIGSGKSEFAKLAIERGYPVISSDDNAKLLMNENEELKVKLISAFGSEIYTPEGNLNKVFISEIIFGESKDSNKNREKLNSIVHPAVIEFMEKEIERYANLDNEIIFVESALMIETGINEGFDYLIAIVCNEKLALERVMKRSNLSENQVKSILKTQISNEKKTELADFTIENNGNLIDLRKSSDFIFELIPFLPPKDFDKADSDEEE